MYNTVNIYCLHYSHSNTKCASVFFKGWDYSEAGNLTASLFLGS